jgi:hypothetical protein
MACARDPGVAGGWLVLSVALAPMAVLAGGSGAVPLMALVAGVTAEQAAAITAVAAAAVASASRVGQRLRACLPSLIRVSLCCWCDASGSETAGSWVG